MNSHRFKQKPTFRTFLDQIPVVDKSRDAFPYALSQTANLRRSNGRYANSLTQSRTKPIANTRISVATTNSLSDHCKRFNGRPLTHFTHPHRPIAAG